MQKIKHHISNIFSSGFLRSLFLPLILVVTGFVAIVAVFVYFFFISDMKKSVLDSRQENLNSVEESLDKYLEDFDAICNGINSNPNFISSGSVNIGGHRYTLSESGEIKKYRVGNSFFTYLLYYRKADPNIFYSSLGEHEATNLWDAYFEFDGFTCDEFIDDITNVNYHTTKNYRSSSKKEEYIALVNPIPITNLARQAFVVAFIDKDNIDAYIESLLADYKGRVVIKDGNGNIFYEYSNSDSIMNAPEKKIIVQTTSLGMYKWTFEVYYEKSTLFSNIYLTEHLMAVVSLLVILVTVIVSMLAVSRKFMPINRLAVSMMEDNENSGSGVVREHELLKSRFTSIMLEQKRVYFELFFSNLLASQYDRQLLDDAIDEYDLSFSGESFCPIVVKAEIDKDNKELVEEVRTIIQECFYEAFESCFLHIQKSPFCYVALLNGSKEQFETAKMTELMQALFEQLHDKNGISINVGIGSVVEDLLQIKKSTEAATSATFYSAQKGEVFYIWADDKVGNEIPDEITHLITKMSTGIKQGKTSFVENSFDSVLERSNSLGLDTSQMNFIAYDIALMLLEYANGDEAEKTVRKTLEDLAGIDVDVNDLLKILRDVTVQQAEIRAGRELKAAEKTSPVQHEFLNKILGVIDEKLCDSMLSLEVLADDCEVSPSYLSRYFKQRTGCTPMAYIENARMDITKKLLAETELSLDEIIDKVGYIDKSNFIRKFRKREDCTPMAYRRMHAGGRN